MEHLETKFNENELSKIKMAAINLIKLRAEKTEWMKGLKYSIYQTETRFYVEYIDSETGYKRIEFIYAKRSRDVITIYLTSTKVISPSRSRCLAYTRVY